MSNLYEPQANQLFVTGLTNWTNSTGDLSSYVTNAQAVASGQQLQTAINAMGNTTETVQQMLQGEVNSLATLQESTNANKYISQVLGTQHDAIQSQTNTVRQQQFKLRDELMHAHYLQRYYQTATNVLIVTTIVVLVLLIPAALWRIGQMSIVTFSSIALVILIAYLCLMVYVSSMTARRHPDAWDLIDWSTTKSMHALQPPSSCHV
jgi:hypothetical protein